jgi:prohibitin 2
MAKDERNFRDDEASIIAAKVGKLFKKILFGAIALVILVALLKCLVIIPSTDVGVKFTMGKVSQTELNPGPHFVIPFFQHVVKISTQQESVNTSTQCFSSDLQTTTIAYTCVFQRKGDQAPILCTQYKGDLFKGFIQPKVEEALKQVTAVYTAEKAVVTREEIRAKTMEKAKVMIPEVVGLVAINITNIDLSDELEKAIEKKMVQEQESLAKKFELEKATKDAEIVIAKAKGEAEALNIKGESLKKTPLLVVLEAMKLWDGKMPQTLMLGAGATPVLPIGSLEK